MKSIGEHNAERWQIYNEFNNPERPAGVACPDCGTELLKNTQISLTTDPPQSPVRCPKCGYRGSIIA